MVTTLIHAPTGVPTETKLFVEKCEVDTDCHGLKCLQSKCVKQCVARGTCEGDEESNKDESGDSDKLDAGETEENADTGNVNTGGRLFNVALFLCYHWSILQHIFTKLRASNFVQTVKFDF